MAARTSPALCVLSVASPGRLPYDVFDATAIPPMGELGSKFRKARESKDLSLDDVSNVIKISPRMLKAIEEENFDLLPGGVFNKGFIRAYAKHLGLDPETAVADYLGGIRKAQLEAQQAWQPDRPLENRSVPFPMAPANGTPQQDATVKPPAKASVVYRPQAAPSTPAPRKGSSPSPPRVKKTAPPPPRKPPQRPSSETNWRIAVVAAIVAVLGFLLWHRRPQSVVQDPNKPSAVHLRPSGSSPTTTPTASSAGPAPAGTQAQPSATAPPPAQSPAAPTLVPQPDADDKDKNDVTIRTFDKPVAKPAPPSAASLTLVVRASANSWVSVSADGQLVAQETLIAPAHPSFHASREFVVKVGNAAAVSFVINGKEITPQGNESEAKTLTFDGSGLKSAPGQTQQTN